MEDGGLRKGRDYKRRKKITMEEEDRKLIWETSNLIFLVNHLWKQYL